jgi:hypothetical protein
MTFGNNMDKHGEYNNEPYGPYNNNILTREIRFDL